ncbi:hypothetical protein [Chitinophaga sp.]
MLPLTNNLRKIFGKMLFQLNANHKIYLFAGHYRQNLKDREQQ